MAETLSINLVTPRGVITHENTDALTAPGELGEFELFPNHVPLLTALKPGVLTLGDRSPTRYAVSTGYLRVDHANNVEVLVDEAVLGTAVNLDAARADLAAGVAELAKWGDKAIDGDWLNLQHKIGWAQARLDAAAS